MRSLAPAGRTVGRGLLLAAALAIPGSFAWAGANDSTPKTETAVTTEGIALDIPGPWADRAAFLAAFAKANGTGMQATGDDIRDADGHVLALFKLLPHDPKLANAIWIGTGRSLDAKTMEKITAHTSVAVVLVPETGPGVEGRLKAVSEAMKKAGGQALRVHYSGLSHGWDRWEKMLGGSMPAALF